MESHKNHCYLLGDFNINLLNCNTNKATSDFIDLLFSHNFIPLINKPTRVTHRSATVIDNIFCNSHMNEEFISGILYCDISDHFPIFTICSSKGKINAPKVVITRNFSDSNKSNFKRKIEDNDWNLVLNCNDASQSFTHFHKQFCDLYDDCFPKKELKIGYKTRNTWLTPSLRQSIKRKNILFLKSRKQPTQYNIKTYKTYRNKLTSTLRHAERLYYNTLLESNKCNLRKSWCVLKEIINRKKSTNNPDSIIINNRKTENPEHIADHFNKYYINIGPTLAKDIPCNLSTPSPLSYMNERVFNTIFLQPVVENEVNTILKRLKKSTAGWDMIKGDIVQVISLSILKPLVHVLNLSISQGTFPNELKIAKVIPLFKSGDKYNVVNYRPISILPFFSKLFERVIYNRVVNFLEFNNVLYCCQFGFRKKTTLHVSPFHILLIMSFNHLMNENLQLVYFWTSARPLIPWIIVYY